MIGTHPMSAQNGGSWQTELASCLYGADGTMSCGVVQQPLPFSFQVVEFDNDKKGGCTKGPVAKVSTPVQTGVLYT